MNTKIMNGKLIAKVVWPDSSSMEANDERGLHMSATYHGDRDEFWIVESDEKGNEIRRHNPKYADCWEWVEPIEPVCQEQTHV